MGYGIQVHRQQDVRIVTLARTESINLFLEAKSVAIYRASAKALAQNDEIKYRGEFNKTVESDK